MSKERKLTLTTAAVARKSRKKMYDFSYPTSKIDELSSHNRQMLLDVLQNPNKDFRKLTCRESERLENEEDIESAFPFFQPRRIAS